MQTTPIKKGLAFSPETTRDSIHDFKRDGFVVLPNILTPDEVLALCEKADVLLADPTLNEAGYNQNNFILRHAN